MGEHEEHYASDGAWWLTPEFAQSKRQNKRIRTVAKGSALLALLAAVAILPVVVGSILTGGA